MKYVLVTLLSLCSSACTLGNWNSIYRSPDLTHGSSAIVDAKQRFVLTYPGLVKYNSAGEVIPTKTISCAEPSPDAFSVYAASGELSVSKGDIGGAGSFATSETGASLIERTTSLQALRDAYFRLCEGFAIGAIDEIDFMIGQRHNQTALMGLLAIEEMKAAAKSPPVVIGSSAAAMSASGIREIAKIIGELAAENTELKGQNTKDSEEKKKFDTQRAAQQTIIDDATKPQAERDAAEEEKKKIDKSIEKMEVAIKKREAKIKQNDEVIASFKSGLENGGPTGSMARSIIPAVIQANSSCDGNCGTQRVAIAKEMVKVVQELNSNDFGPTICLSYLRKETPRNIPAIAIRQREGVTAVGDVYVRESLMAQTCQALLDEYVAGLRERRLTAKILTEALVRQKGNVSKESIEGITTILDPGSMRFLSSMPESSSALNADIKAMLEEILEGKAEDESQ